MYYDLKVVSMQGHNSIKGHRNKFVLLSSSIVLWHAKILNKKIILTLYMRNAINHKSSN